MCTREEYAVFFRVWMCVDDVVEMWNGHKFYNLIREKHVFQALLPEYMCVGTKYARKFWFCWFHIFSHIFDIQCFNDTSALNVKAIESIGRSIESFFCGCHWFLCVLYVDIYKQIYIYYVCVLFHFKSNSRGKSVILLAIWYFSFFFFYINQNNFHHASTQSNYRINI